MADFEIKQHDTDPPLTATLTVNGAALDLSTASSVKFIAKGTTVTITGTCTITSAAAGQISYAWVAGDTDVTGDYNVEFEVTWASGKKRTVPNKGYKTLTIGADLG